MTTATANRIDLIYSWYKEAMMSIAKRNVHWPRAKDKTKTYLYMWLEKFSRWADQYELDDDITRSVIFALVRHAKKQRILHKGSAILQHERIYEVALKELDEQEEKKKTSSYMFSKTLADLSKLCGDEELSKFLARRKGIGGYPNIVLLYKTGTISAQYIAVSRSCRKAISRLNSTDRAALPSAIDLFKINQRIVLNKDRLKYAKNTLGNDFYKQQ